MVGLTRRQHETLRYFQKLAEEGGPAPTYAEISSALGMKSKSNAFRMVEALCERGFLVRMPGRQQSIALSLTPPEVIPPVETPVAEHPPVDQSNRPATRRKRTYAVEMERDLHIRLRLLARKSGMPSEKIIAAAVRWFVMEEKPPLPGQNEESRPAGC